MPKLRHFVLIFFLCLFFVLAGVMDPLECLPVRFHFGGEFDFDGRSLNYVQVLDCQTLREG